MLIVLDDRAYDILENLKDCMPKEVFYSIWDVEKMSSQILDYIKSLTEFRNYETHEISLVIDLAFTEFQYRFNNDLDRHCIVIAVERSCYNPFLLFNSDFEALMTKEQVYNEVFEIAVKKLRGEIK